MPLEIPIPTYDCQTVAALVRAIRRAYDSPSGYGGLGRFTVADIHEFARRLVHEGVRAEEMPQ
jgi:hypothetical protein